MQNFSKLHSELKSLVQKNSNDITEVTEEDINALLLLEEISDLQVWLDTMLKLYIYINVSAVITQTKDISDYKS